MTKRDGKQERRRYPREFKLQAVRQMEVAGNVSALADELGVRRELLYRWSETLRACGAGALRGSGRPRPTPGAVAGLVEQDRIAALERKIGEQTVLIDFFEGALRRIEASRPASDTPGATGSSPRSRR